MLCRRQAVYRPSEYSADPHAHTTMRAISGPPKAQLAQYFFASLDVGVGRIHVLMPDFRKYLTHSGGYTTAADRQVEYFSCSLRLYQPSEYTRLMSVQTRARLLPSNLCMVMLVGPVVPRLNICLPPPFVY
ncbi:MAG: hypothetical protein BWZ07_02406 [Alphaproteobacteria bacterium ADurb.BinA280]|mgnify:CR=1 FL=1|nr:MAG: hypothetical protein BWZ07_02406 [Alphaproteobacteria bacterium ADurb.BinA280]